MSDSDVYICLAHDLKFYSENPKKIMTPHISFLYTWVYLICLAGEAFECSQQELTKSDKSP